MLRRPALPITFVLLALCEGCDCSSVEPPPDGMDAGDAGFNDWDGTIGVFDGNLTLGVVPCQGHIYLCGNSVDDDTDGLADDQDPDCLGPCDNNESGFYLNIPGGDSSPCKLDCYFDQDQGSGNDHCEWDARCDPLEPDPNPLCAYSDPPPPSASCPNMQMTACTDFCSPLVPNGCDCFGCCELPSGSGRFVFIGSLDAAGNPTCTLETMENDADCHPCTPVPACQNTCETCELCLGRTELPPECTPDGGVVDPCSDPERQDCGLEGLPECPAGEFCVTGCCTYFG